MKKLWKYIQANWRKKQRIVSVDPLTYQEHWQLNTSFSTVFYIILGLLLVTGISTYLIIATTGLSEYITGQDSQTKLKAALDADKKTEEIERKLEVERMYWDNLRARLLDEEDSTDYAADTILNRTFDADTITFNRSPEDSLLRLKFQDSGVTGSEDKGLSSVYFFSPAPGGKIAERTTKDGPLFIQCRNQATIHSTLDGTIIFTGWTTNGKYEMHIQHANGVLSMYKFTQSLLHQKGNKVKAGEAIAIAGNLPDNLGWGVGFEIWQNGHALSPENYIIFATYGD